MKMPSHAIEIFLQPGEFYFGDRDTRIRTILGSCVAITMWHPKKHIGGMCHYMLPNRGQSKPGPLDGRFADEAMQMFIHEIRKSGTNPRDYQVKIFGGGSMFSDVNVQRSQQPKNTVDQVAMSCQDLPCRNREMANRLMQQYGLQVAAQHIGGTVHRKVMLDIWSGDVWVKHNEVVSTLSEAKSAALSEVKNVARNCAEKMGAGLIGSGNEQLAGVMP